MSAAALLLSAGAREYRRHPSQWLMTVLGIALGVTIVLAIDLAAFSARDAVARSTAALRGQSTHSVSAFTGALPATALAPLRIAADGRAAPVLEGRVRIAAAGAAPLRLTGIDPVAAAGALGAMPGGLAAAALLARPGEALLGAGLATELGASTGDTLRLAAPRPGFELRIAGVLPAGDSDGALLADIATAAAALGRDGEMDRIDLALSEDTLPAVRAALAPGWRIEAVAETLAGLDALSRSYRINLNALSLFALLVGGFLVYSTVQFMVAGRRRTFGLLRSLGLGRRAQLGLLLAETALLATAGVIVGLAGGVLLGNGLVRLVTRTMADFYGGAAVSGLALPPMLLLRAALLGVGVSLAAALGPALRAVRVPPRAAAMDVDTAARFRRHAPWVALLAAGFAAACAVLLWPGAGLVRAFAGIFCGLVAAALLLPLVAFQVLQTLGGAGVALALAARGAAAGLARTGPSIAALMLAVAAFVGIDVMVTSFRGSVERWLDYTLDADVQLGVFAVANAPPADELERAIAALPGLAGYRLQAVAPAPAGSGRAQLQAVRADPAVGRWPMSGSPRAALIARLGGQPPAIIVSEAYASRHALAAGDALTLYTPAGPRAFEVVDVFRDYGTDQGVIALDLDVYRREFGQPRISGASLHALPGAGPRLLAAAQALERRWPGLRAGESARLREFSLRIFDRTFTITEVMRWIAGVVAFIAVFNALQALRVASRHEVALLRAQGLTPREVFALGEWQTALLGALAGLYALPVGVALAAALVFSVNRIAFGWSMDLVVPPQTLLAGVALALVAALAAGAWPAWRSASGPPADGLRQE